jgi:hypothetical protein
MPTHLVFGACSPAAAQLLVYEPPQPFESTVHIMPVAELRDLSES